MKKFLPILFLLVLITPSIAFASWWNPFTWKIFQRKEVVPEQQLINKNIDDKPKEEAKEKLVNTIEPSKEQSNSNVIITETKNTKKVTPVIENKVIQTSESTEKKVAVKGPDEIDCGRGADRGIGTQQPELDCFYTNLIRCNKSKITLGIDDSGASFGGGYKEDIIVSVDKIDNICILKTESSEKIGTCKIKHAANEEEVKEKTKVYQNLSISDKFWAVYGIPIEMGRRIETGDSSCSYINK